MPPETSVDKNLSLLMMQMVGQITFLVAEEFGCAERMRNVDGKILLSASDLMRFMGCPHSTINARLEQNCLRRQADRLRGSKALLVNGWWQTLLHSCRCPP